MLFHRNLKSYFYVFIFLYVVYSGRYTNKHAKSVKLRPEGGKLSKDTACLTSTEVR